MTYETKIGIEIAGIRRSIPLLFRYSVKNVNGKPTPIHDSVAVLSQGKRIPGDWVYEAIGVRQLKHLDELLLEQSAGSSPEPSSKAARAERERKIA